MKRESMIFYRSFYEAIKDLPLEQQGEIYNAIFSFGLDFEEPELSGISKTVRTLIKPQLEANIKKYEIGSKQGHHGRKGGRPKKPQENPIGVIEKNPKHNPKETPNVNDNVNVNDNIYIPNATASEVLDRVTWWNELPDRLQENESVPSRLKKHILKNPRRKCNVKDGKVQSDTLVKAIKTKSKSYTLEQYKRALSNYAQEIMSREPGSSYYNHRFTMVEFVKQSNGLSKFIDY